ncbi:MAG: hypothetical protein ACXQS7_01700 [Candidatus Syntropharchaeia archaeon]
MIRQGIYKLLIDACHIRSQFESIYGDIDLVVSTIERGLRRAEKLKNIAKSRYDMNFAEAAIRTNKLLLETIRNEKSIDQFKEEIWEIEKEYPEFFKRGRIDIGTPEEAVRAIIHRTEYMVDRYDVRYPMYDMHRCGDR